MSYKEKITKILAFSGWTQDRMADLMNVSTSALRAWSRGKRIPKDAHAALIDNIFTNLVVPHICELEQKADKIAAQLLKQQIADLPNDNVCKVEQK